jgi:hypothetical protein
MTLHFSQIGFTLGRTFIDFPSFFFSFSLLLVPVSDATPVEVVRSDLHLDLVPREDADPVHPHLSRTVRQYLVPVLELDSEHGVGQWLDHGAFEHDGVFLGLGQVTRS